jgi:hypothetical protein
MARRFLLEISVFVGYFIFLCVLMTVVPLIFGEVSSAGWAAVYSLAAILFAFALVFVLSPFAPRWVKQVNQTGISTAAEVLKHDFQSFNGHREGSDYWVKVPVRVHPTGASAYEAPMACKLSYAMRLAIGSNVTVKVDPQNPAHVVLWNEPLSTP